MALRRGALLIGAGVVSEVIYLALATRLSWWLYGGGLHFWSRLLGSGWQSWTLLLAGLVLLMTAYLGGWYAVSRSRADADGHKTGRLYVRGVIWAGIIVFAATLFWLLPVTSDLFTYLSQAHVLTDLGANPLLHAIHEMEPSRLLLAYPTWYSTRASVYGPGWLLLSAPGTLGRYDVATGLFYLKGLAVVAYLGSAWLLERILRQIRPGAALESLYLFAWNPLVLLMAVGDAHNDIVMMALVLLAFCFLLRARWALAFAALALSAWIKYVSIVLLLPFILYTWQSLDARRRWPALGRGVLAAVGISVLLLLPFWLIESPAQPAAVWIGGILERLFVPGNWRGGTTSGSLWALGIGALFLAGAYGILNWRLACQEGPPSHSEPHHVFRRAADTSFVISLLVFVLGVARSQPWYLIWPAALAGLSDRRWAWPGIVVLSALMLAAQFWVEWGAPGWSMP